MPKTHLGNDYTVFHETNKRIIPSRLSCKTSSILWFGGGGGVRDFVQNFVWSWEVPPVMLRRPDGSMQGPQEAVQGTNQWPAARTPHVLASEPSNYC